MRAQADADHEYWREVLLGGGLTAISRWTNDPRPGFDDHRTTITTDLADALRSLARDERVPVTALLLAAHFRVLASLTGEEDVATGYVAPAGRARPCRMMADADSWMTLVARSHDVESQVLVHHDFPVEQLARELELTEPSFETELDPTGTGGEPADDTVLRVTFHDDGQRLAMTVGYRTDVLDHDHAARVAGYHVTALDQLVADPESEPSRQSLIAEEELVFQLEGLAGPHRELPDRRFHELFEDRVEAQPDAVAAVHGDQQWTYRELNTRANQLGRALLSRGLEAETVVAVVTERNLDWMASVLAIFKAGGVYLPVEPHFPADRIAAMLSRAECSLALTEPGSTTTLDQALESRPGIETLMVETAYAEGHDGSDLEVEVGPDQLAYIYFTSGSTGEPKGAMCEHGGMLNHLLAKIDDLEIGPGEVVAQIAPQCFDISLWQLVSALLVGGRTVLIDQETILEPQRFVDRIVAGRVAVMQVVPSYLEVLLTYLDQHPRDLPDLHCVSVTGEALSLELSERWFAAEPEIKLANAYGLTETSDDTNHEVMDRAPQGRVPLGRAVNNVSVRVVDEHLSPVPLGAPGEIVFTGICVGRGYINDPERTKLAFMSDPLDDTQRLYRSGDYGRWRPDGKLEFLGRRDAQVKIRGFRIEIGEIENALLQIEGVRGSAVVVTERADRGRQLVAFYAGEQLEVEDLQEQLGRTLPHYMVPPVINWRQSLPLTDNGKVDKKTLRALAGELEAVVEKIQVPGTPTEQRLAKAWAEVLGVAADEIGRRDNFFDRGGSSLSAVELVIALANEVSLRDVTQHPVLADLALLIDGQAAPPDELLQVLLESDDRHAGALVCFPYAGGNAVNFQAMAQELQGTGLAVLAVELPGHDLAGNEPFAAFEQVVERVVDEIGRHELEPVLLWGHSSGAAFAVATAWKLQERDVDVQRVFLGAQLLGDAADRRAHIDRLAGLTNADIAAELSADNGYSEQGVLDAERAERVGAAYRHDCMSAHRYLLAVLETPPAEKLAVPVTVVVASDDPVVARSPSGQPDWELIAESVDVHELADGSHYFLRTRPSEAAEVVRRVAGSLQTS